MRLLKHLSLQTQRFFNYDAAEDPTGREGFGYVFFGAFTLVTLVFGGMDTYRSYLAGNHAGSAVTLAGLLLCFANAAMLKARKISFFQATAVLNIAFIAFYLIIMFNGLIPSQSELWFGFFVLVVTINSDPKYVAPISVTLISIPVVAMGLGLMGHHITPHELDTLKQILNVSIAGTFLGLLYNYLIHDALDRALQSSRAKTDFLTNMSHEIRTPLNGIFGSLQIVRSAPNEPETVSKYTDVAMQSYHSVLGLINDILDLSKITEGKVTLYPEPASLPDVIGMVVSEQTACANERGISLKFECLDGRAETNRLIDTTRLGQILRNLLSNAIKFTDQGGVKLSVNIGKTSNEVIIVVEDTGQGIPAHLFGKVFEAFEQVDSSRVMERRGTGLGLAITQRLVHAMGGTIELASKVGVGTRFTLTLELPITHHKTAEQTQVRSNETILPARILLAEDVSTNRKIFTALLRDKPYEIVEAVNGKEALVKALTEDFDIVFMDVQMPEMDGLTALKKLQESSFNKPVIAFSANVMSSHIQQYLEAGFHSVIGKPYVKDEVVNAIQTVMARKEKLSWTEATFQTQASHEVQPRTIH